MSRPIGDLSPAEYATLEKSLTLGARSPVLTKSERGLDDLIEATFCAANGDVETAGLLRKVLAERGVGDDGFIEIVRSASEIAAAYRKAAAVPQGEAVTPVGPGRADHTTELAPNSQRG